MGPFIGVRRAFRMTSDVTDLFCLVLIPLAYWYGTRRLAAVGPGLTSTTVP